MKKCVICGRKLKTGKKYCYVCRSIQHARGVKNRGKMSGIKKKTIIVIMCAYFFISSFFITGDAKGFFIIFPTLVGIPTLLALIIELNDKKRKAEDSREGL